MRAREVLSLLLALVVVGGLGYLGYDRLLRATTPATNDQDEPVSDADPVLRDYLAAWEAGDLVAMEELLANTPEDFAAVHEQLDEALAPTRFTLEAGEVVEPEDGRAVVAVSVELTPTDAPRQVSWDTEVAATRNRGQWSIDWTISTVHPDLRPGWVFATEVEDVARRPILAADGTELANDDGRWIGFVPGGIEDPDAVVAAFARALPGSESTAQRELAREQLVDDWFYPVVTVSAARADAAWRVLRRTPGIVEPRVPTDEDQRRVLLDLGFARHVVGVVSEATAEQLEELAADGIDAPVGTRVPQFGLEAAFDDQLTGSEVHRVGLAERRQGPIVVTIDEVQAEPSDPVATTLDVTVQRAIENALDGVELPAAIVAIDAQDGAIRGTASRPLSGFDRARTGRYPPGSTFKTVTLEAALDGGYDLDDEVPCPAATTVGGLSVSNAGGLDLATTTLGAAFAASCNTTFALLAEELGVQALEEAAARFGFGVEPLHPLSAFGGSFPTPQDTAELAAASFGQARVEASPLHLAALAAALPNGVWHQPYLLQNEGPGSSASLATGTADRLRAAFELVVEEGTGTAAAVDGTRVGGKTGTAEVDGDAASHAWFMGTAQGLGFAVLVEGGGSGGEVAAPLAATFVEELLRLSQDEVDARDPVQADPRLEAPTAPDATNGDDAEDAPEVQPEDG